MKRNALILTAVVAAMSLATSAWAGGSMCSGKSEGAAKQVSAEKAAGSHCTTDKAGASMASGKQCKIDADNAVFSYAVPQVHCGDCVDKIEAAAMAQKGVLCAKVDLSSKMAYVAGEKKLNQRAIAKAIKDAGYSATFKQKGPKARAELMKIMASEDAAPATAKKDKV
ncbi:MAG TPA: heavy metal-associated domain-containing protein [Candidatus Eisenbacteria bacterium]|jgi:copper chaperone CopZ